MLSYILEEDIDANIDRFMGFDPKVEPNSILVRW